MPRIATSAVLAAAAAALLAGAFAQEADQEAERPAPAERPETESATPPEPRGRAEGDDVFVPTEEIGADEEITFPVDI